MKLNYIKKKIKNFEPNLDKILKSFSNFKSHQILKMQINQIFF